MKGEGESMPYLISSIFIVLLSMQGFCSERLTFKGAVTIISDSLGYVASANVKTGDSVEYVFCIDNAKQGYLQSAGGPVSWLKDTLYSNGLPLDYIWDSLASVPRMSLGADPSLVMFRGTRVSTDTDVVMVSLGDFRYDNNRRLKAVCINWREYKGSVYDSASYAGFETIEQTDSMGKKKSSFFYFSLVLVKKEVGVVRDAWDAWSGAAVKKGPAEPVSRLVCMPAFSGVLYKSNGNYYDICGRVVSAVVNNRMHVVAKNRNENTERMKP
jgi:hypothetical protein